MTTQALLDALLARKGGDYFAEFQAFMNALLTDNANLLSGVLGNTTSTTSATVGTGSKTFTLVTDRPYGVGAFVLVARTSAPSTWMFGQVTGKSGLDLTVNVTAVNGSGGPFADWSLCVAGIQGPVGATGATGATGPMPVIATTSATSLTVGTGSRTFTTASALALSVGAGLTLTDQANAGNWLSGTITAIAGTSVTINVTATAGVGTKAAWNVQLAGVQGPTGATGAPGGGAFSAVATPQTAGFTVTAGDFGKLFPCSGSFSVTLTTAATLGSGKTFGFVNVGSGYVNIVGGTVNGSPTGWQLAPRQGCLIHTDGSAFYLVGDGTAFAPSVGYVMGGANSTSNGFSSYSNIESYSFASQTTGSVSGALAQARTSLGASNSTDRGYAFGGNPSYGTYSNEIDGIRFDTGASWNPSATLGQLLAYTAAVHTLSMAWIAGGQRSTDNNTTNSIYKFDQAADTVSTAATTLGTDVGYAAPVNSPSYGYILGGYQGSSGAKSTIQAITYANDAVRVLTATMPTANYHATGTNSVTAGYAHGYGGAGIVKLSYASETVTTPSATLAVNRSSIYAGFNDTVYGLVAGGNASGAVSSEIDGIRFNDDTAVNPVAALATARVTAIACQSGGVV